ncbi:hypothetical protein HK405_014660 [Cladochytrium tenue]|nr:hypothetical protein HK405_014660 [Cladochytrium tenue]
MLPPPSSAALLELHSVFSSPASVPRYSERELARAREEADRRCAAAEVELAGIRGTLRDWEAFVNTALATKEQDDLRARRNAADLEAALAAARVERDAARRENVVLKDRCAALLADVEAAAQREANASASIAGLQEQLADTQHRFDALRAQAEDAIDRAQREAARARAAADADAAAHRAKLARAELAAAAAAKDLAARGHENAELARICDELLRQVEGRAATAAGPAPGGRV